MRFCSRPSSARKKSGAGREIANVTLPFYKKGLSRFFSG